MCTYIVVKHGSNPISGRLFISDERPYIFFESTLDSFVCHMREYTRLLIIYSTLYKSFYHMRVIIVVIGYLVKKTSIIIIYYYIDYMILSA
jgi:hypothetical protein